MKRIFSILMVILMLLTLVGCASKPQDVNLNFNSGSTILESQSQDQANGGADQQQNDALAGNQQSDGEESAPNDEIGGTNSNPVGEQKPDQENENESQAGKDEENEVQQPERDEEPEDEKNPGKEPQKEETKEHPWIKVCSYNVQKFHYDEVTYYIGSPMSKFDAVCAELRKINADIVGLQELERYSEDAGGADADQLKLVAEKLGYPYYYFTKTANLSGGRSEYGHGIMSRYPIKESKDYHFYEFYCDASEPRAFSRSVIDVNGTELIFYNSHLAGPVVQQFEVIAKMMAEDKANGYYAVYTADNNAHPHEMQPVANGTILLNTVENPIITSHWQGQPTNPIDNVVITDNIEYYWDEQNKTGIKTFKTTASDHLPVYTEIRFKG